MKKKSLIIYFNGGQKEYEYITFSTDKHAVNKVSEEQMSYLINWLENGPGTKMIECENGKTYCLFRQNINYVELKEK